MAALMSGSFKISGGTWFRVRGVLLDLDTVCGQQNAWRCEVVNIPWIVPLLSVAFASPFAAASAACLRPTNLLFGSL
jgi:hypothetical protein